jgi:hypothetical protein
MSMNAFWFPVTSESFASSISTLRSAFGTLGRAINSTGNLIWKIAAKILAASLTQKGYG